MLLHDKQRDEIMPINRKYPLEALLDACRRYPLRPWEHLTFEYVLLGGFNDSLDDARRVVKLLANLRAKVNLIPWNPGDLPYAKPDPERIEAFRKILADKDVRAFVRYSRGQDVMAACGQLALMEMGAGDSETGTDFAAVTEGGGKGKIAEQMPRTRKRRRGYRGERVLLADADGGHHATCGALFAEAEKEIAAARGAESG